MSDSLLTNNSLQDLSRTYEKHLPAGDIQMVVERAAYSSGDLFFVKLILEPQMKHVRLEHMEITITESRRFHVSEVRANRKDAEQFTLPYLSASKLEEGGDSTPKDLLLVFAKNGKGIDLTDTIAYRITFGTPSCMRNIHHTTYYKDILFKHHLNINIVLSFPDDTQSNNSSTEDVSKANDAHIRPNLSTHSSTSSFGEESSTMATQRPATPSERGISIEQQAAEAALALPPPPATFKYMSTNTNTHIRSPTNTLFPIINTSMVGIAISNPSPSHTPPIPTATNTTADYFSSNNNANGCSSNSVWLSKLRKYHGHKDDHGRPRKRETIRLETPITVFDCRLKEDYGRLPSYSELNVTAHPTHGDDKSKMLPDMIEQDLMLQCMPDSDIQIPSSEPQPQLCPCYFKFRRQMEMASQAQMLANESNSNLAMLERLPSLPPPDYVETT
jgi:hypothetical protein